MSTELVEQARRLSYADMLKYGAGAFANNLQAAASGGMLIVLNLAFSVSPAVVGTIAAIPRLVDAISDPIVGYISDHTRSRWGRRRPYMLCGIVLAGLVFAFMWQVPQNESQQYYFIYFLTFLIVFFLVYSFYATPWVALGYELTPDYNERSVLMGIQNAFGQVPFLVLAPWFLWFMELDRFGGMAQGASILGIVVCVLCIGTGLIPSLFLRERFASIEEKEEEKVTDSAPILVGIGLQLREFGENLIETIKNRDFLLLAGATFLVFNGFSMVGVFQSYVLIYFVYGGDVDAGGQLLGIFGTVSSVATFAVIGATTILSQGIGKKRTFYVMIGLSVFGYLLKWFCYSVEYPYLILISAIFIPCGLGALFTLMGAMIADVCDEDELDTGERREGMYGSIFWWVVKLGMSLAVFLGGFLLEATGFNVDLPEQTESTLIYLRVFDVVVPALTSLIAIGLVAGYSITESKARNIRDALEDRRGII